MAGSRRTWPLGRGFERYYGFLGGETNQWYPDLVQDNHAVDQPYPPEEGYHLSKDLADQAIRMIQRRQAGRARQAWFMYFSSGREPRAAPRARRNGPTSTRASSTRATRRTARQVLGQAEEARASCPRTRSCRRSTRWPSAATVSPGRARRGAAVGLALGRREAAVLPGWPRSTPASRATPTTRSVGCSTTSKQSGQLDNTDHRGHLRQRRQRRGRPERLGQREQVLQRRRRTTSRRTSRTSTSSARPTPTTTTRPAGRGRSTPRTRCSSGTRWRAASPTR